jgi:prepilin-type N-terminal cleavage/methylation domain-containing protein
MTPLKKAFTMLELIFVIIILGIVASIGSELIVKVYESHIIQKTTHKASIKSELAINQIANRLLYRIDKSLLARIPGQLGTASPTDVYPVNQVPLSDVNNYIALEWIALENDGLTQTNQPAWSGFADLASSTYSSVITTGSTLTNETTILNNLAGGTTSATTDRPAIIFNTDRYRNSINYDPLCMYVNNGCIFPVAIGTDTNLTFAAGGDRVAGDMVYSEFYTLTASAYAIVPENNTTVNGVTTWDLVLYSNYQPWLGENYTNGNSSVLARNVSVFRFKQEVNSVRVKLCTVARLNETDQISTCKEKAVIR